MIGLSPRQSLGNLPFMKTLALFAFALIGWTTNASELSAPITPMSEIENVRKRLYPGGRDEEDLKVLAALPEAIRKTDERVLQKDVYKNVFNQVLQVDESEGEASEAEQ